MEKDLSALLYDLQLLREKSAACRAAKKIIIDEAQATTAYIEADAAQQEADEAITTLDAKIRSMALDLHALCAELPEGVKVKKFKVVEIADENKAREWCFTNFRPALKLDTKAFEKASKDGNIPHELATVKDEYRAEIATKLAIAGVGAA